MTETTRYQRWYAQPGVQEKVLTKRRERYHSDPEYRELVNKRNRDARAAAKPPKPASLAHDLRAVADDLGVSVSSLRWWMTTGYYPRPQQHAGKFWFTDEQIELLRPIAELFADDPAAKHSPALDILKTTAWLNWGS